MTQPRYWIGVVSREHVLRGVAGGFAMLNHGSRPAIARLKPGDGIAFYSPKTALDGTPLKAFTAIGQVLPGEPYAVEMTPSFTGYRRDIAFLPAREVPLADLHDRLAFTQGNWGMLARRGHFEITKADFTAIRAAMTAPA